MYLNFTYFFITLSSPLRSSSRPFKLSHVSISYAVAIQIVQIFPRRLAGSITCHTVFRNCSFKPPTRRIRQICLTVYDRSAVGVQHLPGAYPPISRARNALVKDDHWASERPADAPAATSVLRTLSILRWVEVLGTSFLPW